MRQLQTMAVLAMGMTLGLACGDAARELLPPDAGAQEPDGGVAERPAPRVVELECPVVESEELAIASITVGEDTLSLDEMMLARVWLCGREASNGDGESPESQCSEASTGISDSVLWVECGRGYMGEWGRARLVRVVVP